MVNYTAGEQNPVAFFKAGTTWDLEERFIGDSKDIGSITGFDSQVDEQMLTFKIEEYVFVDN